MRQKKINNLKLTIERIKIAGDFSNYIDLAAELNVTPDAVYKWLRGESTKLNKANDVNVKTMARKYGVDINE